MQTYDEASLERILDEYQGHLAETRPHELYKWEAVAHFQEHFDLEADDLDAMLREALGKAGNLLTSRNYLPLGMLLEFAELEPETVRLALRDFLDEGQPLVERMRAFSAASEGLRERLNQHRAEVGRKPAKSSFQDPHSMSVYLALAHPESNYIYKASAYERFAEAVGAEVPSGKFDKPVAYRELLDQMAERVIVRRPGLVEASDATLSPELRAADVSHRMLIQDIAYYAGTRDESGGTMATAGITSNKNPKNYWWLVANPRQWSFSQIGPGEEQTYTIKNENGNYRRIRENFLAVAPGDLVIGYESSPTKKVDAMCEISRERDDERIYVRKLRAVNREVKYSEISSDPRLKKMEFLKNGNGTLFKLTADEFARIEELTSTSGVVSDVTDDDDAEEPVSPAPSPTPEPTPEPLQPANALYGEEDFLSEVFVDAGALRTMEGLLRRKRNLILQGAPGTGKTFAARRLAYAMMGERDDSRVRLVQFHQSTSYDDFVCGWRPTSSGGFEARPGTFVEVCREAAARPDEPHFLIIDEINRANVSKVFGELLVLIEDDHRGESVTLPVTGEELSVPENLYIIGMMNTADRGLALIDYALRRRFAFFEMEPALSNPSFLAQVKDEKVLALAKAVETLNKTIADDPTLGRGFRIGHSYLCVGDGAGDDVASSIVEYEIRPLLEEYWFDKPDKAEAEVDKLRDAIR